MSGYKYTPTGVRDLDSSEEITNQSGARWLDYLLWRDAGGQPLPADSPDLPVPPSAQELAALAVLAADEQDRNEAKLNPTLRYLVTHTPAECAAKVQADVTDLATAKDMLAHFAVALCVLARGQLR